MDCSLPCSSFCGILQARILEWVAISFSRRSSQPRDRTQVSCIAGRRFTIWATREASPAIYFNWRLIVYNIVVVFAIHWHESAMGVHVFPILNPSPTSPYSIPQGLFQCTSFECPVSCIELGLAIRFTYDNLYVSMPFSQIIPPSPSPTESKSLFFTSVPLLPS